MLVCRWVCGWGHSGHPAWRSYFLRKCKQWMPSFVILSFMLCHIGNSKWETERWWWREHRPDWKLVLWEPAHKASAETSNFEFCRGIRNLLRTKDLLTYSSGQQGRWWLHTCALNGLMEKCTYKKLSGGPQTACPAMSNYINNPALLKLHIYLPVPLSGNCRWTVIHSMWWCMRIIVIYALSSPLLFYRSFFPLG